MQKNKGFTLIELMIVIAIIAIIAAIAIPNLVASRLRANEATAISAIKQVATAQVTFQAGRQGRVATNTGGGVAGFCDNFRNLAFGNPVGFAAATEKLALISDAVANAAIEPVNDNGGVATIATTPGYVAADTPYQGYSFSSDRGVLYNSNFAIYGCPTVAGTTGNNAYWVGQQGTVYLQGLSTGTAAGVIAAADLPSVAGGVPVAWSAL